MAEKIVFKKKQLPTMNHLHLTGYKTFKDIHLYLSPINILNWSKWNIGRVILMPLIA